MLILRGAHTFIIQINSLGINISPLFPKMKKQVANNCAILTTKYVGNIKLPILRHNTSPKGWAVVNNQLSSR